MWWNLLHPRLVFMRFTRVVHGIPKWLMEEYLVELGGQTEGDKILGRGWTAEYNRIEDKRLGSIVIGRFVLEIEGIEKEMNVLLPQLEMKLLRGGG